MTKVMGVALGVAIAATCGCEERKSAPTAPASQAATQGRGEGSTSGASLSEARKGFVTKVRGGLPAGERPAMPPKGELELVKYPSPAGELWAYVSVPRDATKKSPAIVWITGGDCNGIDEGFWQKSPASNDQTARAFREAGVVTMYPSLRGGNDNPGSREGFYGEVEDVLAAAEFLSKQAGVDPTRVYLAGHSTGGTLALLVAECSSRFRAVFAFGPVGDVKGYPRDIFPYQFDRAEELRLRSPVHWLDGIACPTFVLEGASSPSNLAAVKSMRSRTANVNVRFLSVGGRNHFSILAPMTRTIAERIVGDAGEACAIELTGEGIEMLRGR